MYRIWLSLVPVFLGFVLTFFSWYRKSKNTQKKDSNPDTKDFSPFGKEFFSRPEVILGTMYAIIAGFAFTEALMQSIRGNT